MRRGAVVAGGVATEGTAEDVGAMNGLGSVGAAGGRGAAGGVGTVGGVGAVGGSGLGAPHLAEEGAPVVVEGAVSQAELGRLAEAGGAPREVEGRLWRPRRVLVTPEAMRWEHGRRMVERAAAHGAEVVELKANRLTGLSVADATGVRDERRSYALAKTTMAVVVSPAGQRKLQPIPPSADWQFHLAQGCPAHCQYCYLAGSLSGPPITRMYANLPEILEGLKGYVGQGTVTSRSRERAGEGTTFEASCYTDPLGIEHLTGALAETVRFFGEWEAEVQLRFTTKFAAVGGLLGVEHKGRTRARFSVNAAAVARDFEGGTAPMRERLRAMGRMAAAGYPVGLTIAPIMPVEGWREGYREMLEGAAAELREAERMTGRPVDVTAELITHRFTEGSREVLLGWYPKTTLDLDRGGRTEKRTKFGGFKYVYPKERMGEMRAWFGEVLAEVLPGARVLYWT